MFIRGITTIVACFATVAFASGAAAQDTTRTRDSMQMQNQQTQSQQMQRQGAMMTAQARDSMIARLLDSANRTQDGTIAQRLRDSVTTLRSASVSGGDTMQNRQTNLRQNMQQQNMQQQNMQQQNMQQQNQTQQQRTLQQQQTSDQRVRMQKDGGRGYPNSDSTTNPPGR